MKEKLLSVIVPVYNMEAKMECCIQSILKQTYKSMEVILVDDGSCDHSSEMCDEWKKKDKRIYVIHKENGGLSSARNAGLAIAHGEYVGFVDSDDFLDITAFEKMISAMQHDDSDMAICNYWCVDDCGKNKSAAYKIKDMCTGHIIDLMLMEMIPTSAWCKVVKRKIMWLENTVRICFEEGHRYEDTVPSFRQALYAKKVSVLSEPLYYYVKSGDSIVAKPRSQDIEDLVSNTEQVRDLLYQKAPADLVECYVCSTLVYALQLWYRTRSQDQMLKRSILVKIDEAQKKVNLLSAWRSKKWKKIIICKLGLADFFVRLKEKRK